MSARAHSRRTRTAARCALFLAGLARCGAVTTAGDAAPFDALDALDARDVRAGEDPQDAASTGDARPDEAAPDAGGTDEGPARDGAATVEARTPLYGPERTQSPLTEALAARLRARVAAGPARRDDVFAKVGASNTVNRNFMVCFAGENVDLGAFGAALRPALVHFRDGDAAGTTPYERASLAATVGWSAGAALAGSPAPVDREIAAIDPRFALVMFGTNDIESNDPYRYAESMFSLTDRLLAAGVLPIISSVPPRDDDPAADANVPRFNAVARGVARARAVPFVDLERELRPIPGHAVGADGIHLNVYTQGGAARGCVFTPEGLRFGQNLRNVLSLTALARARAVLAGDPAPDADSTVRFTDGAGTAERPYEIDESALPFVDTRDTRTDGEARIDRYAGCGAAQDESGREVLYRLTLARPRRLRALVASRAGVDVDVHALALPAGGAPDGGACVDRDDRVVVRDFAAGTHYFSLDTFAPASGGAPRAGEFLFVLLSE